MQEHEVLSPLMHGVAGRLSMQIGEPGKGKTVEVPDSMIYDMLADPDHLYAKAAERYSDPQERFAAYEREIAKNWLGARSGQGVHLYHPIPTDGPVTPTMARAIIEERGISTRKWDTFDGTPIAPGREAIDPLGDVGKQQQVVAALRQSIREGNSEAVVSGIHDALDHYPASSVRNHLIDAGVHPDVAEAQVVHVMLDKYDISAQAKGRPTRDDERIVSAAERIGDKVVTGPNHAIAIWNALDKGMLKHLGVNTDNFEANYGKVMANVEDGFVTSTGRFVTREEAKKISEARGQSQPDSSKSYLNAEDLNPIRAQAAAKHMDAIGYSSEDGRVLGGEVVENALKLMHDPLFPKRYSFNKMSQEAWRYRWNDNTIVMDSREGVKNQDIINGVKNYLVKNGFPEADEARIATMGGYAGWGVSAQQPARVSLADLQAERDAGVGDLSDMLADRQPGADHSQAAAILADHFQNGRIAVLPPDNSDVDARLNMVEAVVAQKVSEFGPEVVGEMKKEMSAKGHRAFMAEQERLFLLSETGKEHSSDISPELRLEMALKFKDALRLGMRELGDTPRERMVEKWKANTEGLAQELLADEPVRNANERNNAMGGAAVWNKLKENIKSAANWIGATTFNLRNIAALLDDGKVGKWTKVLWDEGIWAVNTKAARTLNTYESDFGLAGKAGNWMSPQESMSRVKLENGSIYTLGEMRDLYAKAQFGQGDYLNRRDVNGWLVSNNPTVEQGVADLSAIIKHIQSNPELKTRIESQATWLSEKSKEYYRAACDAAERLGFARPPEVEGIYVPTRREGSSFNEDFSSIFDILPQKDDKAGGRQLLGSMKERTGGYGPKVLLDFDANWDYAMRSMINYSSKAETVATLRSLMMRPEVHKSLIQRFGDESFYDSIVKQIEKEMSPSGRTDPPVSGDGALRWMRQGIYNSFLGFNWVSTPLTQLSAMMDGLSAIGINPTGTANALKEFGGLMKWMAMRPTETLVGGSRHILDGNATWKMMNELSPVLSRRTIDSYYEGMKGGTRGGIITKYIPAFGRLAEKGTTLMQNMDLVTVVSTWRGAFEMFRERLTREHPEFLADLGKIDKMAAMEAERIVQDTQNPSTPAELSLMQGGTEWKRMWNLFSSQSYILWQRNMSTFVLPVARAIQGGEGIAGKTGAALKTIANPQYLYRLGAGVALPGLMLATIGLRRLPKKDELWNVLPLYAMMNIPILGGYIWSSAVLGFGSSGGTFLNDVMSAPAQFFKSPGKALQSIGAVAGVPLTPVKIGERAWKVYRGEHEYNLRYLMGWEGHKGTTDEPL